MKIGPSSPQTFSVLCARVSESLDEPSISLSHPYPNLAVLRFFERDSMCETLSRPTSVYEQSISAERIKRAFVGMNFPLDNLVGWWNGRDRKRRTPDTRCTDTGNHASAEAFTPTAAERLLMRAVEDTSADGSDKSLRNLSIRYIVAYVSGDSSTLRHELAHAFFFLCPEYRSRAEALWDGLETDRGTGRVRTGAGGRLVRSSVEKSFREWGYHSSNFLDEFQAYTLEDSRWIERNMGASKAAGRASRTELVDIGVCATSIAGVLASDFIALGGETLIRQLEEPRKGPRK